MKITVYLRDALRAPGFGGLEVSSSDTVAIDVSMWPDGVTIERDGAFYDIPHSMIRCVRRVPEPKPKKKPKPSSKPNALRQLE